jgi:hypothetical protein
MSIALPQRTRPVTGAPSRSLVPALARQEARRLLLHPLMIFGFGLFVLLGADAVVRGNGPREAFEATGSLLSFYPGVFTILVGGLVATRDRRADSREMLAPVPGRLEERTLALVLASLVPALVGLGIVLVLHAALALDGRYVVAPGPGHLLQGPVTMVGGTLLGVMVATWAPARSTAVITMVGMVATTMWLSGDDTLNLFSPVMMWALWGASGSTWVGTWDGSPGWHVVYLVGLCGMAAAAALLRVAERRTPIVVAGLVALVVTVAGGVGQLP